jgi:hypothetical protein
MYVTSDIFDLKRIARFRKFDWRENLLGGVVVYGTQWRGYQAGARFLLEAARYCGIAEQMQFASYERPGDKRSRSIAGKSFEKLVRGELVGAHSAVEVLFRGELEAAGTQIGVIWVGGEAALRRHCVRGPTGPRWIEDYPYPAFSADFLYPLRDPNPDRAIELLRLAVDILGAEYCYYFVRDNLCGPSGYPYGLSPALDYSPFLDEEGEEISGWADFVGEGRLWTGKWPIFRDLFEVNLISERHTQTPIEGLGYLIDWIGAKPRRGRLEAVGEGRWLWILTDAEMVEVRPVLNDAGVLFSCAERVYRDLPEGEAVRRRLFEEQRVPWAP